MDTGGGADGTADDDIILLSSDFRFNKSESFGNADSFNLITLPDADTIDGLAVLSPLNPNPIPEEAVLGV